MFQQVLELTFNNPQTCLTPGEHVINNFIKFLSKKVFLFLYVSVCGVCVCGVCVCVCVVCGVCMVCGVWCVYGVWCVVCVW